MTDAHEISSVEDLAAVYDPPGSIPLDKVLQRFDDQAAGFLQSATFLVANVRDHDGESISLVAGGPPGFARVLNETTAEIDVSVDDWSGRRLGQSGNAGYDAGFLLILPGVKETLRMKGRVIVSGSQDRHARFTLALDSTFFHCGKALIRSRVWDQQDTTGLWRGLRDFRCVRKIEESSLITSFEFEPVDGAGLPDFVPGQHLPIELAFEGMRDSVRRVYSLSSRPGQATFRISVKREAAPALASNHLHDHVRVGSLVKLRKPAGGFKLVSDSTRPVVLLSAGVGITPMICMLEHLVHTRSPRRIWFLHGAASGREHAFGRHVRRLASQTDTVTVKTYYSRPDACDVSDVDGGVAGRLSLQSLKAVLPWDDYDFYLCGPPSFTRSMVSELCAHGVPSDRVHWETFAGDPHGVQWPASAPSPAPSIEAETMVTFQAAGKTVAWNPQVKTLLDLALLHGIEAQYSCRTGSCFSCKTRIVSGDVAYGDPLDDEPEDGSALLCCARPTRDLVLDL